MASGKSAKQAVFAPVSWLKGHLKLSEVELSIGFPGFGLSFQPSLAQHPQPTRVGFDPSDSASPFVESRSEVLYNWYSAYRSDKPYHQLVSYSEIVLLNRDGMGFPGGVDTTEVRIDVAPGYYDFPARLERHNKSAVELFVRLGRLKKGHKKRSGYLNDELVRVIEFDSVNRLLRIQHATYFDQVGTNLTVDWASGKISTDQRATIRSAVEPPIEGRLPDLPASHLANTLGFAAVVMTADQRALLRIRSRDTAIMNSGTIHCSASGTGEWRPIAATDNRCYFDLLSISMEDEIARELNLASEEYELIPLAFARELPRGGKPQLFYAVLCHLEKSEIESRLANAEERWEFLDVDDADVPEHCLRWLSSPLIHTPDPTGIEACFTYEGWMALRLFRSFVTDKSFL